MKRIIVFLCLSVFVTGYLFAQTDYKKRGMAFVANGNYADAKLQFEAAKAVLESKKENRNSPDFIDVEKKIRYSERCLDLSKQAKASLESLDKEKIKYAYNSCDSEEDADLKKNELLSKLTNARSALRGILSLFSTDKVAKSNLSKCDGIEKTIISLRNGFSEVLAWKDAIEENSIYSYTAFLEKFPDGNYSVDAKSKIIEIKEDESWQRLQENGSFDDYVQFVNEFPNGTHSKEAKAYVAAREEERYWSIANESRTTDSYRNYIYRFPNGRYINEAKRGLAESEENDFWLAQLAKNTVSSYNSYITKYPNGKYVYNARNGIDKLEEQDAWNKALSTNTIEGYKSYLASSRRKAFKQEAEERIASIEHEREVKLDNERWAKIENSTESKVFNDYIYGSGYKGHLDEAKGKYNVMRAREMILETDAVSIVAAYTEAKKYLILEAEDEMRLNQAEDNVAYSRFMASMTESNAFTYLMSFPNGKWAREVSDAMARIKADQMTQNVTEDDYQIALDYAQTPRTRSYVEKKYRDNLAAFKKSQRLLRIEPFHALLGIDAIAYPINEESYSFDFAPVLSLGGHSNRLNLELGYYLRTGYSFVRPRINLHKKQYHGASGSTVRSGDDYSLFCFFIAPEFQYIIQPLDDIVYVYEGEKPSEVEYYYDDYSEKETPYEYYPKMDYGVRVGFGIGGFDFYGGYRLNSNSYYVGLSWYFGKK